MDLILKTLLNSEKFGKYIQNIKVNKLPVMLTGLTSVAKVQMMSATSFFTKRKIVYVTSNEIEAKKIYEDFLIFNENTTYFPKRDIKNFDTFAESKENLFERINVLNEINENKAEIIVTTIDAITQSMILPKNLYKHKLNIKIGDILDIVKIAERLVDLGYERQDLIDGSASFSIRGGIIDISLDKINGVRIELWGDEVESIRIFNILTQRSVSEVKNIIINPATEFILTRNLKEIGKDIENIKVTGNVLTNISDDLIDLKENKMKNKIEKYFKAFYPENGCFLNYLDDSYLIILDEVTKIKNRLENIIKDNELINKGLYEKGKYGIESLNLQLTYDKFLKTIEKEKNNNLIYLSEEDIKILDKQSMHAKRNGYSFNYREVNFFRNTLDLLFKEIEKSIKKNDIVILFIGDNEIAVIEMLENRNIKYQIIKKEKNNNNKENNNKNDNKYDLSLQKGIVNIYKSELSSGYYDKDLNILLISFIEIFTKRQRKTKVIDSYKKSEKIRYSDLKLGDYVVHRIYGIGRFLEIMRLNTLGITKDYIKIEYRGGDFLYVPTNALDNIRKYISKDGITPKLNKLRNKRLGESKNKSKK